MLMLEDQAEPLKRYCGITTILQHKRHVKQLYIPYQVILLMTKFHKNTEALWNTYGVRGKSS